MIRAAKTYSTTAPALRAFSLVAEIVVAVALVAGGSILIGLATLA